MPTHDAPSIKSLFVECLRRDDPQARQDFLDEACGDNLEMKDEVLSLLSAHGSQDSFLERSFDAISATAAMPAVAERPGTMIGPYKLREQIGEGGFGIVYVAEQEKPVQRKVALKIIKPGMDSREIIARFEAERQALALMDHPNIAKVLDAGTTGGIKGQEPRAKSTGPLDSEHLTLAPAAQRPYFVMELVRGIPITAYCDRHKLTTEERLKLFVTVCRAVQHAHMKGVIHRDIKPSNVLVTQIDGVGVPKVIDFGVAKAISQRLTEKTIYTQFAQMIGTPAYMSPEQAEMSGVDIDTRTDVYSLGVLLYQLLTGSTPFDRDVLKQASFDEFRRIIREDDPPRPSMRISTLRADALSTLSQQHSSDPGKLSQALRGELDWIVMQALEKDRTRRYESASAFAADIERYLSDEPVQACPPSLRYRLGKYARRHKGLLTTATLVLIAMLSGTGASLWQAKEAADARQLADERLTQVQKEKELAQQNLTSVLQAVDHALGRTPDLQSDSHNHWHELVAHKIHANVIYSQHSKDPEAAIVSLTSQIARYPRMGAYHLYRGVARRQLGRFTEALDDFATAMQLDPDDKVPHISRGDLYTMTGQYSSAISDYNSVLREYQWGHVFKRRAFCYFQMGRYDLALEDVFRAVDLDPATGSNLVWIPPDRVASCPDQEFQQRLLDLAETAVSAADTVDVRGARAELLTAFGDWNRAREDFDAISADDRASAYCIQQGALLAIHADNPEFYRELCRLMLERFGSSDDPAAGNFTSWTCSLAADAVDDYARAIELARNAVKTDPEDRSRLVTLGAILMRAGEYDEAKATLEDALEGADTETSSNDFIHYFLAMTEYHLGNDDIARTELQVANGAVIAELPDSPAWNRRLTLELLRDEAESLINSGATNAVP